MFWPCGLTGIKTEVRKTKNVQEKAHLSESQQYHLLQDLRCADTSHNERNQLPGGVDGINTLDVVPAYRELDAHDEPGDTENRENVPPNAEPAKPSASSAADVKVR